MKLIIWWLTLMFVLPLGFLFWWKKTWRLLIGVIIGITLLVSFFLPDEIVYSKMKKELMDKRIEKPLQNLETALKNVSDFTINPSDSEKLKLEKRINSFQKQCEEYRKALIKKRKGKVTEEEAKLLDKLFRLLFSGKSQWIERYGGKENSQPLLFCGEEFNKELSRETWDLDHSTIDFSDSKNSDLKFFNKKLQQIHEQGEMQMRKGSYYFLVWLKNIDKITSSELKNELLKIVDPTKNADLGRYGNEITIDFSNFFLVVTTSSSDPQLSSELSKKMNHIEHFLDKYFWAIFLVSSGLEIITFYLLTKSKKKSESKPKKFLNKFYSVP